jgi:transposase-like protein
MNKQFELFMCPKCGSMNTFKNGNILVKANKKGQALIYDQKVVCRKCGKNSLVRMKWNSKEYVRM